MSDDSQPGHSEAPAEVPAEQAVPAFSPGAALREARERLGLSVDEVAGRTKLAPRQIEALEADDFARLPETTFVRGFVRSYAKLLQIDAAPLLAALPHASAQSVPLEAKVLDDTEFSGEQPVHKPNLVWLGAALLVAILMAVFAWLFERASDAPKTRVDEVELPAVVSPPVEPSMPVSAPVSEPVSAPAVALPAALSAVPPHVSAPVAVPDAAAPAVARLPVSSVSVSAPLAPGKPPVRLVFSDQAWVEITGKDGRVLLSLTGKPGEEASVAGAPPFGVVVGYASGVKLYYKGKLIDLAPYARSEVARLTLE